MSSPRFHIVVPVLNQGAFVAEALTSLLSQASTVRLGITVMDGGSSDNTLDEVRRALGHSPPPFVTVHSSPDGGQSDAIEKGLKGGQAEIVGWLNADDRIVPGALARVVPLFVEPDVAAVYGDTRYISETGEKLFDLREQDFSRRDLLWGPCYVPQPSTFVARWAWNAVGGLRPDLHYAMDLDLWLRLSKVGRVVHLRDVLSEFRVHGRSKSVAHARAARREAVDVRRQHLTEELQRVPSRFEMAARRFGVRCRRRLRAAARHATAYV